MELREKDWKEHARRTLTPLLDYRVNGNSSVPAADPNALRKMLFPVLCALVALGLLLLFLLR